MGLTQWRKSFRLKQKGNCKAILNAVPWNLFYISHRHIDTHTHTKIHYIYPLAHLLHSSSPSQASLWNKETWLPHSLSHSFGVVSLPPSSSSSSSFAASSSCISVGFIQHEGRRRKYKRGKEKKKEKKRNRKMTKMSTWMSVSEWTVKGKKQTQIYINISTWRRKNQYSNDWELQEWKAELCEWLSECVCEWHFEGSDIWSFEWRGAGSKHTHITFNELRDLYSFTHRATKQKYTHTNTANTQLSSFSP